MAEESLAQILAELEQATAKRAPRDSDWKAAQREGRPAASWRVVRQDEPCARAVME